MLPLFGSMFEGGFHQQKALIRRYAIILLKAPIKSAFRLLIWPGLLIGGIIIFLKDLDKVPNTEQFPTITTGILYITIVMHIYAFCDLLVRDKATGIKSLMISMGLRRANYYCAMSICSLAFILPISFISAILLRVYILERDLSLLATLVVHTLFALHLDAFIFFGSSFLTSPSFVFIVPLLVGFDFQAASGDNPSASLLFVSSLMPFLPLKLFYNDYVSQLNIPKARPPTLALYLIILAQLFWTCFFGLFACWFEEVCPWQKFSAVRSACFCIGSNNNSREVELEVDEVMDNHYFERRSGGRTDVGIQVSRISKKFKNVPAVSDVSLSIFKGETTLLLGHNGAGKTTLMNMILGLLAPDSGKVHMRAAAGICPQASVLDDNLNVVQHLELFNDIKSDITGTERQLHIKQTLGDVGLADHWNKAPTELSGGMKRKLSLAMAFVGKSEVLILDEPSSGLDPDSRMYIWNAIQRYRAERTVLLSTQHMEEADYLGDRIAILSAGRLVCCGSSLFLNKLFGCGYKLRIECDASNRTRVLDQVRTHFKGAKMAADEVQASSNSESNVMSDFVVELRLAEDGDAELQMIELLTDLENNKDQIGIKSFGLKSSSIEDVMLNTGKELRTGGGSADQDGVHLTIQAAGDHLETLARSERRVPGEEPESAIACRVIRTLLKQKWNVHRANKITVVLLRLVIAFTGTWLAAKNLNMHLSMTGNWQYPLVGLMANHYAHFPSIERVSKFKAMLLSTNTKIWHYWASWFLFDQIFVASVLLGINMSVYYFTTSQVLVPRWKLHGILTLATYLFCLASMSLCYLMSNILSRPKGSTGYILLIFYSSSLAYLLEVLLAMALRYNGQPWYVDVCNYIGIVFLPTDAYVLIAVGLFSQCYIQVKGAPYPCEPHLGGVSNMTIGFSALIFQTILYTALLFLIESQVINVDWYIRFRNLCPCFYRGAPLCMNEQEVDEDVQMETARATAAINQVHANSQSLVAAGLRKSYVKGQEVIRGLSFAVQKGECFGLLGVNGAGKTTTFSMLVAESPPDSGRILADGVYSHRNLDSYRQKFGFGPQSNPDLSLTPHQALCTMARLRGTSESSIVSVVHATLELLSMSQHEHKADSELSGGTKRKLVLGMALVGNPDILALDEPTAGVDPLARRNIWQLLKSLRSQNKASIVISSHAMEECEAICDRISIMARGRLRCIGSFLHLRSKFAKGCRLRVTFAPRSSNEQELASGDLTDQVVQELRDSLEASIGSDTFHLSDRNITSVTFEITDNRVRRSLLFQVMRDFRQKHANLDYTLNDASLEEIFISLAKEQQTLNTPKN